MKSLLKPVFLIATIAILGFQNVEGQTAWRHFATAANISHNSTYLDHPSTNNNPRAVILVTPMYTAECKAIGVWYDTNRSKWAIFNQNQTPMRERSGFVVSVETTDAFIHRSPAVGNNYTHINHPLANNNPNALVLVTQRWNMNAVNTGYNNRFIGVWYDASVNKWAIYNEDIATMGEGLEFNVKVIQEPKTTGNIQVRNVAAIGNNLFGNLRAAHDIQSSDLILVTHNWNPGGTTGTYLNQYFCADIEPDTGWFIGGCEMTPVAAHFNVLIFKNAIR